METNPGTKRANRTNRVNRTDRRLPGIGRRFMLRLLAVALLATACTLAGTVPVDAAQRQRPNRNLATSTNQLQQAPPTTTRPAPTPAPRPQPVDDRAQLAPDALEFVAATALPAQPEFSHLFGPATRHLFAESPTYTEPVDVRNSELRVDRTIGYELEPGVCKNPANQRTLGDLCFSVDRSADITGEIAAHLRTIRRNLDRARQGDELVPGISVGQARRLSDIDLLELSLNSGPRSITRTSVLPITADGSLITLDPADPVVAGTLGSATRQFEAPGGVFTDGSGAPAPFEFDTEYFLTGHTVYRSYSDEWSYEKDAWWHPRIFVSFSYSLNAGFGVRAPFSIDVDHVSNTTDGTVVAVSVDPVSLDVAADEVGLASGAYFGGKEFVLELNFDCELEASVAGIGGSVECDDIYSIDTNFSRDFDPVIGGESRTIQNWFLWEDGKSPLRQELAGGAIYGEVNLGIGADVVNGEASVQIGAGGGTTLDGVGDSGRLVFDDRNAEYITVQGGSVTTGTSFTVSDPEYRFDVAVRPKAKFTAGIDTAVYENSWSFIAPLDFLGFSIGFGLDHHDGTVESHRYELAPGLVNDTAHVGDEVLVATREDGPSSTDDGTQGTEVGNGSGTAVFRPGLFIGTATLMTAEG